MHMTKAGDSGTGGVVPAAFAEGAGAPGIVVTPEMVSEGVDVFEQLDQGADGPVLRFALESAFRRMSLAQRRGR